MDQKLSLRLDVEGSDKAQTNVSGLRGEFVKLLEQTGKSPKEIAAFLALADGSKKAATGVDQLDDKTRELLTTYQTLKSVASARDTLNLIPHDKIKKEIEDVKQAYETLKASGTLSHKELAQAALKTETAIRELEKQTTSLSDSFAQIKGSLAGTVASFGGLTLAARQAMQFESAMADVRKVVDGTDEQMAALATTIKDLSGELPISADGLAQIAAAGGRLDVPIERIAEFTRLAAQMATAFDMSAEEAGNAVAKLANVFHLPIEGVGKLGDAINVLGNNTAATETAIVDVLTRISGSAVQFGLAGDQAAALAATMLSLGTAPQVVATGLNAMMARLQTANGQSAEFRSTLASLVGKTDEFAQHLSDKPQEALLKFIRSLERLDKQSRAETLMKLFGIEYQDDIAKLVGALGQYESALGLVGDQTKVAGAMQREFETRMQTTEAQIELLKNAIEVMAINLGSVFLPIIKNVAGGFTDVTRAIADFIEEYPAIAGLISVVGTLAVSLGTLKIATLAARVAFGTLLDGLPGKFAAMNTSVLESVEHLGKLKTAGLLASAAFTGWEIGSKLSDEFAIVRQAGVALVAGLVEGAELVRYAWEVAKAVIGDDTIEAATQRHTERLAEIRDVLTQQFIDAGKELKTSADSLTQAHQQTAQAATESGTAQTTAAKAVAAAQKELKQALKDLGLEGKKTGAEIVSAFKTVVSSADTSADTVWKAFQAALKKIGTVEELQELKSYFVDLADAGVLSSERISAGLAALDKQLATTTAALDPVQAAFEALGVTSAEMLAQAAEEAKKNFETIAESGQATAVELETAFMAYAKAAIAAAEMVSPAEKEATEKTLEHEAASRKLKNASEELAGAQKKQKEQTSETSAAIKDAAGAQWDYADAATEGVKAITSLGEEAKATVGAVHAVADATKQGSSALGDMKKEADGAAQGLSTVFSVSINEDALYYLQNLESMSEQAAESMKGLTKSADVLKNKISHIDLSSINSMTEGLRIINEELERQESLLNSNVLGMATSAANAKRVLEATQEVVKEGLAIERMRADLVDLTEAESASMSALSRSIQELSGENQTLARRIYGVASQAETAAEQVKYLGEEDLSQLRSAIDSAKNKIESMTAAARAAREELAGLVDSLTEELLQSQGKEEELEALRYQKRLDQLKSLYAESGNLAQDEYREAVELARKLHQEKMVNIKAEKEASGSSSDSGGGSSYSSAAAARYGESKTVRIDFGDAASGEFSEADADKLLDLLKSYGARTV